MTQSKTYDHLKIWMFLLCQNETTSKDWYLHYKAITNQSLRFEFQGSNHLESGWPRHQIFTIKQAQILTEPTKSRAKANESGFPFIIRIFLHLQPILTYLSSYLSQFGQKVIIIYC